MVFKKKPTGAALQGLIGATTEDLPSAAPPPKATMLGRGRAPPTVQVNFRCTEEMARALGRRAIQEGSTRKVIAQMLANAGDEIPEADLNPPITPRRT
jgi:hypothetical protein